MSTTADALRILQAYVKRNHSGSVSFNALVAFAEKYLVRAADTHPELEDFADSPANLMAAYLVELAKDRTVELQYSGGTIMGVVYPEYYFAVLRRAYERVEQQPDRPFPAEDGLPVSIPSDFVTPVDVKAEFVNWLARSSDSGRRLLRLMYAEGVSSMLVSTEMLDRQLPRLAVQKIRQYLRSEKNAGYMRSKLGSIFRQRERAMTDLLNSIQTTPDQALRTIAEPTEFTFHFWTQLSSTLIKEYGPKKDKLVEEHGYCQAAYLLGYYSVHHRGVLQRRRDTESALRDLENTMRKPPYAYTIGQIHAFTDNRGVPLTKRCSKEDVNNFIAERIKATDGAALPDILRVKTSEGSEFYLYQDFVVTLVLESLFESRKAFRDRYVAEWTEALKSGARPDVMNDDKVLEKDVTKRLKETDPLLHALLNFNLLYLVAKEANVPGDVARDLRELFDDREPKLRPMIQILNLDRKRMLADARLKLPFWQAVPVLSSIVRFFKRLFVGLSEEEREARRGKASRKKSAAATTTMRYDPAAVGSADEGGPDRPSGNEARAEGLASLPDSGGSGNRRAQLSRFKDAVRALQAQFIGENGNIDRTLEQLIDRWNPILDGAAKENLVEDVNSLARDFLRRMRVTFKLVPPTKERVTEWADRIVINEAFEQIRRKDILKEYLELYILKLLGK